jgi:transposase
MEVERSRKRRRYSAELKAQILAECATPGASVAKVALSHGINANIVHGWRKRSRNSEAPPAMARQEFVPVTVAPTVAERSDERGIEIELRRGAVTIKLLWPLSAADDLAAWTRELLR